MGKLSSMTVAAATAAGDERTTTAKGKGTERGGTGGAGCCTPGKLGVAALRGFGGSSSWVTPLGFSWLLGVSERKPTIFVYIPIGTPNRKLVLFYPSLIEKLINGTITLSIYYEK